MGSVAAALQEDSTSPSELEAAFLERCAASGDAAYGELRELLARLHDPATRQEARVFLTGLRRRSCSGEDEDEFFRRYGFCVRELLLHDSRCGLPITTLSSVEDALQRLVNQKRLGQGQTKTAAARHISEAHEKPQLSCQA